MPGGGKGRGIKATSTADRAAQAVATEGRERGKVQSPCSLGDHAFGVARRPLKVTGGLVLGGEVVAAE